MHMAVVVLLVVTGCLGFGADTYYVSPAGRDSHDGRSAKTPWKTMAKVNATAFPPGSRILFERGGEWRESLSVAGANKGAPGTPLVFDAYGSGAKPKFLGSEVLLNASFVPAGNNTYRYTMPGLPGGQIYVLQDHQFLDKGPANYSSPTLTITSASDPRSDGKVYTVCVRGNVIASAGSEHLVFRNLIADETAGQMADGAIQGYGIRIEHGIDIVVEDCEVYRAGRHHIGVINSTAFTGRRIICGYAAPAIDGGNSLYVSYADHGAPVAKCVHQWLDCIADHAESGTGGFYEAFISHGENQGSITFQNFRATGGKVSLMSAPTTFTGGVLSGRSRIENFGDGFTADGTTFKDQAFIDQWGNRGEFQNLLFAQGTPGESGAIIIRPDKSGNVIRFNTFSLAGHECIAFYGAAPGTRWYGNIMLGTAVSGGKAEDVALADYNFYGNGSTIMGKKLMEWQALGKDAHAQSGDPLFVKAGGEDYTLQAASPCVDGAGGITGADRPITDFNGALRPAGTAADIGALELGGKLAPRPASPKAPR